ncbi:hypothetical protein [Arthrobacter sp. VKM Ac-2550]|uniref:hypothetical protein n=1 Tax=Crystallibacter permensis TaxID=1938888 RepID=UPI002227852A|nr:hypothetical protein [Arthrobacter sp. VKM Ac-2550]MCW2132904.1 hypothetical protein [Arthrobacter sp. VKM Ac-2550]
MSNRLWEHEHDFYGPEGSFWGNGMQQSPYINRFDSWAGFVDGDSMHGAIMGLNFLYRWDWHAWHIDYPEDYPDGKEGHELELFWMMPRKGIMARSVIAVTPNEEDAVRAWLLPHAEYMRKMWAPLIPSQEPASE